MPSYGNPWDATFLSCSPAICYGNPWESMFLSYFSKICCGLGPTLEPSDQLGTLGNDENDEVLVFVPRLRPRTAAPSCKECRTCENRSTTKFWHREVLALSSSPSYLKNQTSLRERFPKERGGVRFQRDPRCSPKQPLPPLMYVKSMSNLCQMYALAAPLLVHFRAPKSLCASRCYALVRSTIPTKQESDRFNAAARRFAGLTIFHGDKNRHPRGKIGKIMQKHAFVWESMG